MTPEEMVRRWVNACPPEDEIAYSTRTNYDYGALTRALFNSLLTVNARADIDAYVDARTYDDIRAGDRAEVRINFADKLRCTPRTYQTYRNPVLYDEIATAFNDVKPEPEKEIEPPSDEEIDELLSGT